MRIREGFTSDERWLDDVHAVVTAWYGIADDALLSALRADPALDVHGVGDCLAPRRAIAAAWW